MRESGLRPLVLVGVLAVGAVSGLVVALSVSGLSLLGDGGLAVVDADLAEAAIGQPTTTVPASPAPTSLEVTPGTEPEADIELWSAASPPSALLVHGVFATTDVTSRLASFLVHDGMIITSAAAVDGQDSLWLRVDGRWVPASVTMADPYTDVALLQTADSSPDELFGPSIHTVSAKQPEPGDQVTVRIAPTGDGSTEEAERSGLVVAPNGPVKTSLNRHCYDAFITPFQSSIVPPGSALIDEKGVVVAMTISTPEPTAAAIPMTKVVDVARSMTELGSPAAVWLGIEAGADTDGRTRVLDVVEDGPAADVLIADDVILSVDGRTVENPDHLVHLVRAMVTGTDTELMIERDGMTRSMNVRPSPTAAQG